MALPARLYVRYFRSGDFNALSVLIYGLVVAVLPQIPTFQDDTACWGRWSAHIFRHGLSQVYDSDTNYLPLYHYILWAYGKVAGSEAAIWHNLHYLRSATLLFDMWGIRIIWRWMGKRIPYNLLLCICLLNPAYAYDTIFWGQVDGIEAALVAAALYAAWRHKVVVSGCLIVLALNMKLQALIFLPFWLLLVLPVCLLKGGCKQCLQCICAMAALQLLILWPFAYGAGSRMAVWRVIVDSFRHVPKLSLNAYNWWYWAAKDYPGNVSDELTASGLSYKRWGLILFIALSVPALWPIAVIAWRQYRSRLRSFSVRETECIWLSAALCCLLAFFCNTEMHERYVTPAFIFLTAYAFGRKTYWLYGIFSLALLLNLEGALHWLALRDYSSLLFNGSFVAVLYAAVIVAAFAALYHAHQLSR